MENSRSSPSGRSPGGSQSHIGFFVAMLVIVALGGGAYLMLDKYIFAPTETKEITEISNPPLGHQATDKAKKPSAPTGGPKTAGVQPEGSK